MDSKPSVGTVAVTAVSAALGAVGLKLATPTLIGLISIVGAPPVALALGAVGGGLAGWNLMRGREKDSAVARPYTS